jgi:hypothetical protein
MECAVAALSALQKEIEALEPWMAPSGRAVGDPAGPSHEKSIREAVGKLVAQSIDESTGQPVAKAVRPAAGEGLRIMRVGDSIRLSGAQDDLPEEPPADASAQHLLAWLAAGLPATSGAWVAYPDLRDHLYPRFQAETGLRRSLGSVLRGLNKVTRTRDREYTDRQTGKRKTLKEYLVPAPAAAIVDLEA